MRCIEQFILYLWFLAPSHKMRKYLSKIVEGSQNLCKMNKHILKVLTKSVFKCDVFRINNKFFYHRNFFYFFPTYIFLFISEIH
jgi:hypothetical protein